MPRDRPGDAQAEALIEGAALARITQSSTIQPPPDEARRPNAVGVFFVSCLPLVAICLVLFASGGTSPGFLIPAITCGVVLGMLVFIAFREGPAR